MVNDDVQPISDKDRVLLVRMIRGFLSRSDFLGGRRYHELRDDECRDVLALDARLNLAEAEAAKATRLFNETQEHANRVIAERDKACHFADDGIKTRDVLIARAERAEKERDDLGGDVGKLGNAILAQAARAERYASVLRLCRGWLVDLLPPGEDEDDSECIAAIDAAIAAEDPALPRRGEERTR